MGLEKRHFLLTILDYNVHLDVRSPFLSMVSDVE